METCYIALGSNQGERIALCEAAVAVLDALPHTTVNRRSSWYETEPVVDPARHAAEGSPSWFINGVAELKTALSPIEIFRACLRIEQQMGRKRSQAAPAPLSRSIDLDLLLHGDVVMKSEELTLPHPRFHLRRFVLAPLAEVAPTLIHPTLELTIAELLGRLSASDGEMHRVLKVAPAPQPH